MFKNDFVAVVKANGKILREDGSTVLIPFGCEYSLYMKNLRAQKAQVSVTIDGVDVLNGSKLLINGNSTLDLERFLTDDMSKGNRFKFIQKTAKIQEHRGDRIDDGIVRVTFQYEKPVIHTPVFISHTHNDVYTGYRSGSWCTTDSFVPSGTTYDNATVVGTMNSNIRAMNMSNLSAPKVDEGITVKGSESNQSFREGYIGTLEEAEYTITLQLKGFSEEGQVIKEPVTVKTKKVCETCGTTSKSHVKYCPECGTFLG